LESFKEFCQWARGTVARDLAHLEDLFLPSLLEIENRLAQMGGCRDGTSYLADTCRSVVMF
jgi:hypothetical protein